MTRDMELIRKILFAIEDKYVDVALYDIKIAGYEAKAIAYHCAILHEAGLLSDYKGQYAGGELYSFGVGRLTWEGHELLDKIKSDTVWNRTKETIKTKGLPFAVEIVKEIATAITTGLVQSAIAGLH